MTMTAEQHQTYQAYYRMYRLYDRLLGSRNPTDGRKRARLLERMTELELQLGRQG